METSLWWKGGGRRVGREHSWARVSRLNQKLQEDIKGSKIAFNPFQPLVPLTWVLLLYNVRTWGLWSSSGKGMWLFGGCSTWCSDVLGQAGPQIPLLSVAVELRWEGQLEPAFLTKETPNVCWSISLEPWVCTN